MTVLSLGCEYDVPFPKGGNINNFYHSDVVAELIPHHLQKASTPLVALHFKLLTVQ